MNARYSHRASTTLIILRLAINVSHSLLADVLGSSIGFGIFTTVLAAWSLSFSIGGEALLGSKWSQLTVFTVADEVQMWLSSTG